MCVHMVCVYLWVGVPVHYVCVWCLCMCVCICGVCLCVCMHVWMHVGVCACACVYMCGMCMWVCCVWMWKQEVYISIALHVGFWDRVFSLNLEVCNLARLAGHMHLWPHPRVATPRFCLSFGESELRHLHLCSKHFIHRGISPALIELRSQNIELLKFFIALEDLEKTRNKFRRFTQTYTASTFLWKGGK